MRPMAEKGARSLNGAGVGGRASGESRRLQADETWKPHALEIALGVRTSNPALSQERVASQIQKDWRLSIPTPAHSTLRSFNSDMVKEQRLPARKKRAQS